MIRMILAFCVRQHQSGSRVENRRFSAPFILHWFPKIQVGRYSPRTRVLIHVRTILLVFTACSMAIAQSGYYPVGVPHNSSTIAVPLGFVDPLSQQVHLEIPIASVPIREGHTYKATLVYDTTTYYFNGNINNWSAYGGGGWFLTYGGDENVTLLYTGTNITCPDPGYTYGNAVTYAGFSARDSNATVHPAAWFGTLEYVYGCTNAQGQHDPTQYPNSFTAPSGDGSGYTFVVNLNSTIGTPQAQIYDIGGNQRNILYGDTGAYTDTNGNSDQGQFLQVPITFTGTAYSCSGSTATGYVYVYSSDGTKQTYTFTCTAISVSNGTQSGTVDVLSALALPDGTSYKFGYDKGSTGTHSGQMTSVTMPTGGALSLGLPSTGSGGALLMAVAFGGGTWNFSSVETGSGLNTQMVDTVTGPSRYDVVSKSNVRDKTRYTSALGGPPWHLAKVEEYSGSSTLLETTSYGYTDPYGNGCLNSVATTLNDTNQSSSTYYQYESIGNPAWVACSLVTNKQEYDFGASSPTRTTKISYQGDTASIKYNSVYYIYDRPAVVGTYAGSGTGSPVSQTSYTYDEYGASYCKNGVPMLTNITGAINHDDSGHGSSFWARGNPTSVSRLVSGSTFVTSHKCYDTLGNITQEVDPAGNPTTLDYSENWADTSCIASGTLTRAFPTTLTDALGYRTKTTRFSCTGLSSAIANENDLQANRTGTTSTYDWANRPLCTNYPDGGQTCDAFFMTAHPPYTTRTVLMSSNSVPPSLTTETILDGYGRVSQTQLTSDPSGTDYTDTTYDAFGRAASVSNSYRSTSDSTYGITTTHYDALGRPTQVVEPDGSAITTSYSGNSTTVIDEASKQRNSQSDAFGRLTSVVEDPANLNYTTVYSYDLLDNLVGVVQKGSPSTPSSQWRQRSFTYDGLSRLVCAANPEIQSVTCPSSPSGFPTGAITYTYDSDSNLRTIVAPAPNQPQTGTKTVTTTYTYDVLNRLTGTSYNDAYNGNLTPSVTYGYDGALLSCPTPIGLAGTAASSNVYGHRTAMCFANGSTSWIYDSMGRIATENDRLFGLVPPYNSNIIFNNNGVETISTDTTYAYYLNGDLQNVFSPADYEFYTDENAAGQVTTVGDTRYNVLDGATYAPTGQLASGLVGIINSTPSYAGTSLSNTYNNRLQPVLISATTPSASSVLNLTFNFNLGNGTTGTDNGNVIQIVNGKDGNRTQNFLYDSLNRIQQAYTTGPNWGETYSPTATAPGVPPAIPGIDAWGNLTNRSGVTGKTNSENALNCAGGDSGNHLNTCFIYDAAGNLIQNGSITYTYDAEGRLIAAGGYSYLYDGDGNRIEKCTQGTQPGTCAASPTGTFYWPHQDGGTLAESDLGGNFTASYGLIRGQIAVRLDFPGPVPHYYFHDHLGSTSVVTDNYGNISKESDYYPYGGEIPITSNDSNRYKFTGKERDTESGLDYFGARHYTSSIGRFMVPDPGGPSAQDPGAPQSWNLYSYVQNNPLRAVDPSGLDCVYTADSLPSSNAPGTLVPGFPNPSSMQLIPGANNTFTKPGDCASPTDNGFYFDGTVDPSSVITTRFGDVIANVDSGSGLSTQCSGECPNSVISATVNAGEEEDLSPSAWQYALAIRGTLAHFPTICSYTFSGMVGAPGGSVRLGAEYNTEKGLATRGRYQKGIGPVRGRITVNSHGKISGNVRVGGTYGATIGFGPSGWGGISSLGFSANVGKFASVGLSAQIAPVYSCPGQQGSSSGAE